MTPHEIQRALRTITSRSFKREARFPVAILAQLAGVHRATIYLARDGRMVTDRIAEALSPVLTAILNGQLTAKRGHRTWQVWTVAKGRVEERRFPQPGKVGPGLGIGLRQVPQATVPVTPDGRAPRPKAPSR